jgi:hypothetical protein
VGGRPFARSRARRRPSRASVSVPAAPRVQRCPPAELRPNGSMSRGPLEGRPCAAALPVASGPVHPDAASTPNESRSLPRARCRQPRTRREHQRRRRSRYRSLHVPARWDSGSSCAPLVVDAGVLENAVQQTWPDIYSSRERRSSRCASSPGSRTGDDCLSRCATPRSRASSIVERVPPASRIDCETERWVCQTAAVRCEPHQVRYRVFPAGRITRPRRYPLENAFPMKT